MNQHLARTYRRRRASVLVVIFILVFIFLLQKGLLKRFNPFFSHIVAPIWQTENFAKDFLLLAVDSKLRSHGDMLAANEALKVENESLKALMGRIPADRSVVLSSILAKPNTTPYDTLIIDRGSKQGVKVDDLVFAGGDILIGEIESVQGNGSFEVDVSREVEVGVGDMFFYPGLDNTLVGVVKKIDFDSRDSFKNVIMKSPINIQEERWVEVKIN